MAALTIGERIKQRREQLGMTQIELAEKAGFKSKSSINKIELGVQGLKQSKIKAVAEALNLRPSDLMGWHDEQPQINLPKNILTIEKKKAVSEESVKILIPRPASIVCSEAWKSAF